MDDLITQYDEDYFLRGKETGKSLYENYRWLPKLTIPMAKNIIARLGIEVDMTVLDYGCACGYTVRALREIGIEAFGVDISEWAIRNCDPTVREWVVQGSEIPPGIDWIIAKDVLEHIPDVKSVIDKMMDSSAVGIFVAVPLSLVDGQAYVIPDYEKDVTHVHRLTLASWVRMFIRHKWSVECCYRFRGVKDNYHGWMSWVKSNYDLWQHGNGFIICRRV